MLDQEILIFIADLADSFAYAAFNHRLNILIIKIALSVKLLVRRVYEKFFDNFLLSLKNIWSKLFDSSSNTPVTISG